MNSPAGLADVARLAGVSPATASRVLSGRGPASARARRDVLDAAARLDYAPHPVATALARRGGTRIVVAVRDLTPDRLRDQFVVRATSAIAADADAEGLGVSLRWLPLDCRDHLDTLARDRGVTAVILSGHDRATLQALPSELHGRFAAIGAGLPGLASADVDSAAGVRALVRHLRTTGRERIALVCGPRWLAASRAPLNAYLREVIPARVVAGDFSAGRGRRAAGLILRRWPDTDAIVTVSDATAVGVLEGLGALGIRVPDDVAVTGFDDLPLAAGLTTATHPVETIATAAVRQALHGTTERSLFPSVPVLGRTSCGGSAFTD